MRVGAQTKHYFRLASVGIRNIFHHGVHREHGASFTRSVNSVCSVARFLPYPLILLALMLASGCTSPTPTPPIDIYQAATQTAEALLGAPDTFDYPGIKFNGLDTYQTLLTLTFEGKIGGVASRGALDVKARIDTLRPAATGSVSVTGDAQVFDAFPELGTYEKTYILGIDYHTGAGLCLTEPVNFFDPLLYSALPDVVFAPDSVPPLHLVGPGPSVNGAPTWRFRLDNFSTPTLQTATIEILVADEGAHVVRVDLRGEGYLPEQKDAYGTVMLHYELFDLNQPVEITLPPVCAPTPEPSPTPEATPLMPGEGEEDAGA